MMYNGNILQKKILKIPKGYAEAVNRKKTDDTMANRQTIQWPKEKRQTIQWPKEKGLKVKQRITIYKK